MHKQHQLERAHIPRVVGGLNCEHSTIKMRVAAVNLNKLSSIVLELFWRESDQEGIFIENMLVNRRGLRIFCCKVWLRLFADNSIAELNRNDFTNLGQSLKVLDMSGNSLTSIPEGVFSKLQRLETLYLSRNNIHNIHSQAFQKGVCLSLFHV